MNTLKAIVSSIQCLDNLNIVNFDYKGNNLSMMSLGLNNIKVGSIVLLSINASNIAIAKEFEGEISLSNKFTCSIKNLTKGELLSCLKLKVDDLELTSIITTNSLNRMNLKTHDKVIALVKASELSIQEVIS